MTQTGKKNSNFNQIPVAPELVTPVFTGWLRTMLQTTGREDVVTLENKNIDKVSVVAKILRIEDEQTKVHIWVDDSTGVIKTTANGKSSEPTPLVLKHAKINVNEYIKMVLQVNCYEGNIRYTPLKIQTVTDHNMLTLHMYRTLLSQRFRLKTISDNDYSGKKKVIESPTKGLSDGESMHENNSSYDLQGLSPSDILTNFLRAHSATVPNISHQEIHKGLRNTMSSHEINQAIKDLSDNYLLSKNKDGTYQKMI